jgi:hypothetical protein
LERIPSTLPFRVEIWDRAHANLEETLAAASSLPLAIGAFEAACQARPKNRVLLCNLAQAGRQIAASGFPNNVVAVRHALEAAGVQFITVTPASM